ncbi:hypothetical protein [Phaeacidiphilus oryzae]|jgi:hypothetical protein|uniref:hypothetical protein n=1 Tax=Phaeacidiphilus oryzae TaxID=348818 RepID=UPI00068FB744|nr:hypothetical protein [Phaeacidiphilus oryzae]
MEPLRPQPGSDAVDDATLRYLMYGVLPGWFVPGIADWVMHRRTRIEDNAGVPESAIHALMMAEVGLPLALALAFEVDPALLAVLLSAAGAHEATAVWDLRTAERSGREVRVAEQYIHNFLGSLPIMALSALACLHADQMRELGRRLTGRPAEAGLRLVRRRRPLPRRYLLAYALAAVGLVGLPYGEEFIRCVRAAVRRRREEEAEG